MTTPPSPTSGGAGDDPREVGPRPVGWLRPPEVPTSVPRIGGPSVGAPPPDGAPSAGSADPQWSELPMYPPMVDTVSAPAVRTVDRKANRGLVAVAVAVILAGGGFAVMNFGPGAAAGSPEGAVDDLLHSISGEDVIGTLETLRPAERDAMKGPLEDTVGELERLELLADVDLGGLQGVDIELEGYELRTTELTSGVVAVTVSGGTVSGAATPTELPIGDTLRAILEEDLDVELPQGTQRESDDLGEFQLVAVEEGGGWYVSPGYSLAEWARSESGDPLPAFDSVVPVGADSPEGTVRALADAAVGLDAEQAITQLDPEEMAALYDYAPLFLDDAEEAAIEAREDTDIRFELTDLRTEDGRDGTKKVYVEGFALQVDVVNDYEDSSFSVSYDGDCFEYRGESEYDYGDGYTDSTSDEGEWCAGEGLTTEDSYGDGVDLPPFDAPFDQLALVTVERDGRWYVAPGRSILEVIPAFLRGVDESDVETLREWIREFVGPVDFEEFDDIGSSIEDGGASFDGPNLTMPPPLEPLEECFGAMDDQETTADPSDADAPFERISYLSQQAFEGCVHDLVAAGELEKDEAQLYMYDEPCWAPYEALTSDASADEWRAADAEVRACFDGVALDHGDTPVTTPDEPATTVETTVPVVPTSQPARPDPTEPTPPTTAG